MVPGVQKLNAASIPVVNLTDRSAGGQFVSFVGCDDERLGLSAGRYLLQHLNGKGNVIIIEGVGGSANSAARSRGFQQAIREFPAVKLVASQPGNFQRLQALQVTENLLQAHPQIDGVLAANDAMALGAIEALDGANRKAAVVASMERKRRRRNQGRQTPGVGRLQRLRAGMHWSDDCDSTPAEASRAEGICVPAAGD